MSLKGSDYSAIPLCPEHHGRMDTKKGKGIFEPGELDRIIIRCLVGYIDAK